MMRSRTDTKKMISCEKEEGWKEGWKGGDRIEGKGRGFVKTSKFLVGTDTIILDDPTFSQSLQDLLKTRVLDVRQRFDPWSRRGFGLHRKTSDIYLSSDGKGDSKGLHVCLVT